MSDRNSDGAPGAAPGAREAVLRAVEQFNRGEFWECHETLEDFWGEEHGPLRDFYHGLIQVAAAFVHVRRLNWYGAVRLIGEGRDKLEPFQPACLGVDVAALVRLADVWQRSLATLGPERMAEMAVRLVENAPRIETSSHVAGGPSEPAVESRS